MTEPLGRLEDLPAEYLKDLDRLHLSPLSPQMRNVLPHHAPKAVSKPCLWSFRKARPLLLKAGELTPVEKAERRVLALLDPGRGNAAMQVTASIYCDLQLLLPGERASAHKHTPRAARVLIEGDGAFTHRTYVTPTRRASREIRVLSLIMSIPKLATTFCP